MRLHRPLLAALLALTLTAGATACSSNKSDNKTDSSAGGAFPVTIKSSLGTASIKEKPKRVVTLGWGSQDDALALGVVPVGMPDFTADAANKSGILPWDAELLKGKKPALLDSSGTDLPYEKILSLKPDLILATNSGLTKAQFKQLNEIAPTVAPPGKPWLTTWQQEITTIGKALGKSKQAAKLKHDTDKTISDAAKAHPEFKGKTIAFGSGTEPGSFNFYSKDDSRVQLLQQLGFKPTPAVEKLGENSQATFAKSVSLERISDVKSQVLVSWYLDKGLQKSIEETKTFASLPAIKSKSYVPLTDPPMVFATSDITVLSLPWMLNKYVPLLSTAAKNAK